MVTCGQHVVISCQRHKIITGFAKITKSSRISTRWTNMKSGKILQVQHYLLYLAAA